jgi:N-acetylglucosaminyldiphosphoundecaprenol N-acetyl-beta-D-mannosaminyltransferase
MLNRNNCFYILKMKVCEISMAKAVKWALRNAIDKVSQYICVANVHMCMESFDDYYYTDIINNSGLVVPDGKPLFWCLKLLGCIKAHHIRGADLMIKLCSEAIPKGIGIGFYGSTSETIIDLKKNLKKKFPEIKILFAHSPPFRELTLKEEESYIADINKSNIGILFVGLGCPKQEIWMAEHKDKLSCVMIGVGAAFDFYSGKKKHAPIWMQKVGFEWTFRLMSEPRRLWKRYLKHNPRFVWYFCKQLLGYDFSKNRWA